MAKPPPGGQLEELGVDDCLELLAGHEVGRLAVVVDGQPVVFPVNYALVDRTIVFRSDPGSKLAHSGFDHVAFEVDDIDPVRHRGWSVVEQGLAIEFTDALDDLSERVEELQLWSWVSGEKSHWVRIDHPTITGRRIGQPPG